MWWNLTERVLILRWKTGWTRDKLLLITSTQTHAFSCRIVKGLSCEFVRSQAKDTTIALIHIVVHQALCLHKQTTSFQLYSAHLNLSICMPKVIILSGVSLWLLILDWNEWRSCRHLSEWNRKQQFASVKPTDSNENRRTVEVGLNRPTTLQTENSCRFRED